MAAPTASVIINNFNYEQFVASAIESALAQTQPGVEVIVVDDGSSDRSTDVIEEYRDRVTVITKPNGGQASALNAGFAASSGEVVIFLDADDALDDHAVERVVRAMVPGVAKVHFRLACIDADGRPLGFHNPPRDQVLGSGDVVPSLLATGRYVTPPTSGNAFPRWVLDAVMPVPEEQYRISADGYLVSVAPFHGTVVAIEEPLGCYRVHGQNAWAPGALTASRLRSFIAHDHAKHTAIAVEARRHDRAIDPPLSLKDHGHLRARLASLRLDPAHHPHPEDRLPRLLLSGISSVVRAPSLRLRRRVLFILLFFWLALMPRRTVAIAAGWFYLPQRRPLAVRFWLRPVQTVHDWRERAKAPG